ncbi:uncharacterized protein NFIA_067110 [Aspergillus fischeri NRRL 181]|uniref:Secreted protein n=1 Tax=Neosartorya fischeri (strain ATCC 1020 / DSM 3700 / CBS 544.65 / FGSC A1164 / JCM 1740 / NRRL 181 / WB 181) TaxID=331117 RepID=A1D750_NEOFI|nr:conserved hypothetical protein [Aspergillus fischeri NRRL 181]EAW21544.1 conserved hypothetical protein [Aspergillus fischeri NRRL 181]
MKASTIVLSAVMALCVNPALARVPGRPSTPVPSSHTSGHSAFWDTVFKFLHPIRHTIRDSVHDSMPVERPQTHRSFSLALFHVQPSSERELHTEWKATAWRTSR